MHTISGSISLPSPGFFSPFPHGTGSLSVSWEYLALEDGPPMFSQDSTCPDLLDFTLKKNSNTGLSPSMVELPNSFFFLQQSLRAVPLSLAATNRISVDFFSYRYLDVSVPRVRFIYPMNSDKDTWVISSGFPHSEISGSKLNCQLPEAYRRLSRPSSPSAAKASVVCT